MSGAGLLDLDSREQIAELVVRFYREVIFDERLGPVFDDVARVDWSVHIPKLVDFWSRVLLGQPGYEGPMLAPHQRINDVQRFEPELFDRWYGLFVETVDEGWRGPVAERAKDHAQRVARTLAQRLTGAEWDPPPRPVAAVDPSGGRP